MRADRMLIPWYLARALHSRRRARALGLPGLEFDSFGRWLGWRLCLRGIRGGLRMLLQPVDFLRYFEFDFVNQSAKAVADARVLDVSSPCLFSLRTAAIRPDLEVCATNPDVRDSGWMSAVATRLGIPLGSVEALDAEGIARSGLRYDFIYSISVFEHIAEEGDGEALRVLSGCLNPGGRICLTVMTDRRHRDEFLEKDPYQLGRPPGERGFFFQRFYDEETIHGRLLERVPELALRCTEWVGEVEPGIYDRYIARSRDGFSYSWAVVDPLEAAIRYRRFDSFREMPGVGICCLELERLP